MPLSVAPAIDPSPEWSQARIQREVAHARVAQTVIHPGTDGLCVFWTTADQSPCLLRQIGRERELNFPRDWRGHRPASRSRCIRPALSASLRLERASRRAGRRVPAALHRHVSPGHGRDQSASGSRSLHADPVRLRSGAARPARAGPGAGTCLRDALPTRRTYAPLMLLWRGIGRMAARFPGIRHLFGAASIASTHSPAARALMLAYLRRYAFDDELAPLVSARRPPSESMKRRSKPRRSCPVISDLHALNAGGDGAEPWRHTGARAVATVSEARGTRAWLQRGPPLPGRHRRAGRGRPPSCAHGAAAPLPDVVWRRQFQPPGTTAPEA